MHHRQQKKFSFVSLWAFEKRKVWIFIKNYNLFVQLANALLRLYDGRQRALCCATLSLGSYAAQETFINENL